MNQIPHNLEAEKALLGSILLRNSVLSESLNEVTKECFWEPTHQLIFESILCLTENKQAVDVITLSDELRKKGQLSTVGGAIYISELVEVVSSVENVESYKKIIIDNYVLRSLIKLGENISTCAYKQPGNSEELLANAQNSISELCRKHINDDLMLPKDLAEKVGKDLDYRVDNKIGFQGISSGYSELDKLISGLGRGHFVVVAGLTGMGKTAFLLDIIKRLGIDNKIPCVLFSLEMSLLEILHRLVSKISDVPCWNVKLAHLNKNQLSKIHNAIARISESEFIMSDSPSLTLGNLQNKLRKVKAKTDIQLAVIDYLQLISNKGSHQTRQEELSGIARGLKETARELDITIVSGAQLNSEAANHQRPKLEHIRESRTICHEADSVIFLNRPRYHDNSKGHTGELIVAKARHGKTGICYTKFDESTVSFVEKEDY